MVASVKYFIHENVCKFKQILTIIQILPSVLLHLCFDSANILGWTLIC